LPFSGETELSFEPLQVCGDGSDFSGLLADHPWVPGSVFQAPVLPDRSCCSAPQGTALAEGIPQAVYRPPRSVLS
jgi:hypothetical protein